ncbi:MAG TPA: hypothetical protein VFF81_12095 [Noviherbaspirillum sp.]|nr:hypothetical protein [Noviherbaspirillum sp.]
MQCILWANQKGRVDKQFFDTTGARLQNGIKVLLLVKIRLSPQHGFSLIVSDIDPDYTIGDMQAKMKRIREALATNAIAKRNRSLPAPVDFTSVAVIAPSGVPGWKTSEWRHSAWTTRGCAGSHIFIRCARARRPRMP